MFSPVLTFFTGTDTDVGKTYCAAQYAATRVHAGSPVGVCKPVASGCRRDGDAFIADDAVTLWNAAGKPGRLDDVCTQSFEAALSPPMAAAAARTQVDSSLLIASVERWRNDGSVDEVIVEGAGGLFSPISEQWLNIDLILRIRELDPTTRVVLVAANRLGVQHQVIAATRAAAAANCRVDLVWLNRLPGHEDDSQDANAAELRRWIEVPIVESTPDRIHESVGSPNA